MPDLIPDEIETLRMLAGQLPRRLGLKHFICALELADFGLCTSEEPYRLTGPGLEALEAVTGTIDLRSRRIAHPRRWYATKP
ncbi:MAG TPA: hypothetical protein VGO22_07070 [Pseudorhizobium sp.]|jgi:hypothetical protein|nr:hypothetical protein [Pseudorhizobium sp.]